MEDEATTKITATSMLITTYNEYKNSIIYKYSENPFSQEEFQRCSENIGKALSILEHELQEIENQEIPSNIFIGALRKLIEIIEFGRQGGRISIESFLMVCSSMRLNIRKYEDEEMKKNQPHTICTITKAIERIHIVESMNYEEYKQSNLFKYSDNPFSSEEEFQKCYERIGKIMCNLEGEIEDLKNHLKFSEIENHFKRLIEIIEELKYSYKFNAQMYQMIHSGIWLIVSRE